jgi:hypothetical protein
MPSDKFDLTVTAPVTAPVIGLGRKVDAYAGSVGGAGILKKSSDCCTILCSAMLKARDCLQN